MKKLLPIFIILFVVACKKEEFSPAHTKVFSMTSTTNGATYSIKVALPDNYNPVIQKYATLYLLDGEENFDFVATKSAEISNDNSSANLLVISIGYGNNRAFDYTPTLTNEGGGGAENFMLFIKNELIPKVTHDYGADTTRNSRIILGHSFGGLFAAYAFAEFNDVFGNYLMLSPSLWYDNELMLGLEQMNREINSTINQLVFMGIGELEGSGRMQAPFEAFYQRLTNNYTNMKIKKHQVPNLDHVGSKNKNVEEALKFYFQNK